MKRTALTRSCIAAIMAVGIIANAVQGVFRGTVSRLPLRATWTLSLASDIATVASTWAPDSDRLVIFAGHSQGSGSCVGGRAFEVQAGRITASGPGPGVPVSAVISSSYFWVAGVQLDPQARTCLANTVSQWRVPSLSFVKSEEVEDPIALLAAGTSVWVLSTNRSGDELYLSGVPGDPATIRRVFSLGAAVGNPTWCRNAVYAPAITRAGNEVIARLSVRPVATATWRMLSVATANLACSSDHVYVAQDTRHSEVHELLVGGKTSVIGKAASGIVCGLRAIGGSLWLLSYTSDGGRERALLTELALDGRSIRSIAVPGTAAIGPPLLANVGRSILVAVGSTLYAYSVPNSS